MRHFLVICAVAAAAMMLAGCRTAPDTPTPTLEVTTPATSTAGPHPTDRATVPPAFTPTPTAVQPTIAPPTSTPASLNPARATSITAFDVEPASAHPGDTVTLRWAAQGDRAVVCPSSRYALFTDADCANVPLSGTYSFSIPTDVKNNRTIEFILTVTGPTTMAQTTSVALYCARSWFFSNKPQAGVCPQQVITTEAAFQPFERGLMVWLKAPGRYFVLETQNVAPGDIRRPLATVDDPLRITRNTEGSVRPPAGLFAPVSGFGLIWRGDVEQSPALRDRLGWALQPETGYTATYQCDDATPSGGRAWQTCYLTLPDGQIIAALSTGAWYWREEQLHQGVPKILTFTASRAEAQPGDTITLAWTSIGGTTATLLEPICCTYAASPLTTQPLNGSVSFALNVGVPRDTFTYILTVSGEGGSDSRTLQVRLPCPDRYFFATTTHTDLPCPAAAPLVSPAAEQLFEGGRMIWLQAQRKIYVLFGDGQPVPSGTPPNGWLVFDDTWQPGEPESDPSLVPPAGRYQPVRGFGKVWRSYPVVREGLGWALGPEQAFEGAYQRSWKTCLIQNADGSFRSCSGPGYDFQYLRAAEGRLISLAAYGAVGPHGVQQWEILTP